MKEKLFITVILLLCLVPSLGMLLPKQAETGGNEVLAAPPSLRDAAGKLNAGYLPQLDQYVEDNYFLRQQLVSAWSALNQNVLHTSIASGVVLGSGGWLYFSDTLNDYTGAELMTDREIFCAARNLSLMREFCQQSDAQLLFTIAPNKNSLYPSHMPSLTITPHRSNAEALAEKLGYTGPDDAVRFQLDPLSLYVHYLDLFSLFREREETLYFTQDSHWNSKGAALAADGIINASFHLPGYTRNYYFDLPFTPEAIHRSDLYDMLYPTGQWLETDQIPNIEFSFSYDTPFRSPRDMTIQTSGGSIEMSLLMFRDSFGELLYPYLADTFQSALFSRSMPYNMQLVLTEKPDLVVIELVERNLDYLIQNAPLMPAPSRELPASTVPVGQITVPLEIGETDESGLVLVKGKLPVDPDADSFIYLCTNEACFETFLLEDNGFALYMPAGGLSCLSVVFTAQGELASMPASAPN